VLFSPQIPLPLEPRRVGTFDDFVAGPNQAIVDAVRCILDEPAVSLYLHGAESSGKTHLLNALCHATRDAGLTAFYAALGRMPLEAVATLEGLEGLSLVCVDDLEAVAGNAAWEEALFHLFNRLRASEGKLVVTGSRALTRLPVQLPDLRSRLASGLLLQLQALGEHDKLAVLERHALSLGVELPAEVGRYLLSRGHRSLGHLLKVVERLQHNALAAKRRITVPLAREILKSP
jgi:DnaA family protein